MKTTSMTEQPNKYPTVQVNGAPLKPLTQVLLERRATMHFKSDPVPDEYIEAILRFGAQAPSGYNLQPWRFLVIRDAANRQRLRRAAMDQAKVSEAPVVIVAFAVPGEWKTQIDAIFAEGVRRGLGKAEEINEEKKAASEFLDSFPPPVWLNRHTMIAVTTMMLVAEAYGFDTAPMEGFDPEAVKREFGLPAQAEVVALLAIGLASPPDKGYGGRLLLEEFVHVERYGSQWTNTGPRK
jgi:nitroreductase